MAPGGFRALNRQLYIINNNLRDRRGHYFETSLAIAEAARNAGLHPIVGAHVECPVELFPAWLESYPIFTTDHWMTDAPSEPAKLMGVIAGRSAVSRIDIERARRGESSVRDYLNCRLPGDSHESSPYPGRVSFRRSLRHLVRKTEEAAYRFLPATAYQELKAVYRHGRDLARSAASWRLSAAHRETPAGGHSNGRPVSDNEHEYSQLFCRDLDLLLWLTAAQSDDLVLLGTAHGRELLAVQELLNRNPREFPTFHLEFRHPVFQGDPHDPAVRTSAEAERFAAFFRTYRQRGETTRIRFHTDTCELATEYAQISGLPFGVLPIPFRSRLLRESGMAEPDEPLNLTFLGDARDEKGFHWFPELIHRLHGSRVGARQIRFRLQATPGVARYNPLSAAALKNLQNQERSLVELPGLSGPLTDADYYELLSDAHVVLLPYDRFRYRAASSGTLTEAIAAGKPTVVPDGTWMSAQQPAGSGATFSDFESFVRAVRYVIDNYDECARFARQAQATWRSRHSPSALIESLLATSHQEVPAAA